MKKLAKRQKKINQFVFEIYKQISCFECDKGFCCKQKNSISITQTEKKILLVMITQEHINRAKIALNQKAITKHYDCPFLGERKSNCVSSKK